MDTSIMPPFYIGYDYDKRTTNVPDLP